MSKETVWLTAKEAAKKLGITVAAIGKQRVEGRIKFKENKNRAKYLYKVEE